MIRRLLFLLPLALFAAIALYLGFGLTRDASVLPSALIDQPAPVFSLPGLSADAPGLDNTALQGQVALVNVFASWCVPCRAEHPQLMALAREGWPIYGIAWKDKAAESRAFLAELGNPFRAVGHDGTGRAGIDWGVYGVPETYVIDREGRIRYRHVGPLMPAHLEERILPLLKELGR